MSRIIEPERIDAGDLTEDEVRYLQDRGKLPDHIEPVDNNYSKGTPLEQLPHTGDANTTGYTLETWNKEVRRRQDEMEEDQPRMVKRGGVMGDDESRDDEEYEEGWNNDSRRAELAKRGLSVDGRKEELIARLRRSDTDQLEDNDYAE